MITLKKSNWRQIQYNLLCILCIVTAHNLPINCCSLIGASLLLVVPLSELRTLGARVSQELDGGEDSSCWRDGNRTEWSSFDAENVFWWKQERKVWRKEISSRRCWDNSCQLVLTVAINRNFRDEDWRYQTDHSFTFVEFSFTEPSGYCLHYNTKKIPFLRNFFSWGKSWENISSRLVIICDGEDGWIVRACLLEKCLWMIFISTWCYWRLPFLVTLKFTRK